LSGIIALSYPAAVDFRLLSFLGVYLITRLYVTSAFGNVGIDGGPEETGADAPLDPTANRAKATTDLSTKLADAVKDNTVDALKAARLAFDNANPRPLSAS
jgi:hypothetical protein